MRRFTVSVNRVHQSTAKDFKELDLFHHECGNYRIKVEQLNPTAWGLKCKRCGREIIVKNSATGDLPIMQTAVDGEPRTFNHELATEKVLIKS